MNVIQNVKGRACIKFHANGLEVSISCDDSCKGNLSTTMHKTSLCIFEGENNITGRFFGSAEIFSPSNHDVMQAIQFIKNYR